MRKPLTLAAVARPVAGGRRPRDAYASAGGFLRPLIPLLGDPSTTTIVECCAGAGDLVRPLEDAGFAVFTADIDPATPAGLHADMTLAASWAKLPPAEWVVSNLPFSEAIRILPHAIKHASVGVAVILRLSFLEPTRARRSRKVPQHPRAAWLHANPLTRYIVLPRYSYTGDGKSDNVTCAWCLWERDRAPAIFIPYPDDNKMPGAALRATEGA